MAGKPEAQYDPYVLNKGVQYRLHKQVLEENNNRNDLIAVQENFATFEAHVIQSFQQAMSLFLQLVSGQAERQKTMYGDMVGKCQNIPRDFEWINFLHRNSNVMIDPQSPRREASQLSYPNQDHKATQPLISGTLERKSRALGGIGGYKLGYYVVTAARYFHQFDSNDNFKSNPTPDLSLYLPDCTIGALSGERFNIKGKDASKGKVGRALEMSHELAFKAHSPADAAKWYEAITKCAGITNVTAEPPSPATAISSPISSRANMFTSEKQTAPMQTQDLPLGQGPQSDGPGGYAEQVPGGHPGQANYPANKG